MLKNSKKLYVTLTITLATVLFIYALAFATEFVFTIDFSEDFYLAVQEYNAILFYLSLAVLVVTGLFFVFDLGKRQRLGVTNVINGVLYIGVALASSAIMFINTMKIQTLFGEFSEFELESIKFLDPLFNANTKTFLIGFVIAALLAVFALWQIVILAAMIKRGDLKKRGAKHGY